MTQTTKFTLNDKVTDRDGFSGVVSNVTFHNGSHWYDVRFERGEAVRCDEELALTSEGSIK